MASPQMRGTRAPQLPPALSAEERHGAVRRRAAARLLGLERTDEVYPVLLEEIVAQGFVRALVLAVDLESGEIRPAASLNCSRSLLNAACTTIWAADNPVVAVLHGMKPTVLSSPPFAGGCWYCHPILFNNPHACWEAQRNRGRSCLAVSNHK